MRIPSLHSVVRPAVGMLVGALLVGSAVAAAPQAVDRALPAYAKSGDVSGIVRIAGSSAASALLADACGAFKSKQPNVSQNADGKSSDGVGSLVNGTADILGLERPLTATERSEFQAKFGYAPTEIVFALDAIAVVVPEKAPVTTLTVADVAALFGASPKGRTTAKTWADVGVTDKEYAALAVDAHASSSIVGLATASTSLVLGGGAFRGDLHDQSRQSTIASGAAKRGGVGLIHPFFISERTRPVAIAKASGQPGVALTPESVASGAYPFGRRLYAYVNMKAGTSPPAHVTEFLRFALSRDGQEAIANKGGLPLTAALAAEGRGTLGAK